MLTWKRKSANLSTSCYTPESARNVAIDDHHSGTEKDRLSLLLSAWCPKTTWRGSKSHHRQKSSKCRRAQLWRSVEERECEFRGLSKAAFMRLRRLLLLPHVSQLTDVICLADS
eukprot:266353-Amphidinium_carterae.2